MKGYDSSVVTIPKYRDSKHQAVVNARNKFGGIRISIITLHIRGKDLNRRHLPVYSASFVPTPIFRIRCTVIVRGLIKKTDTKGSMRQTET